MVGRNRVFGRRSLALLGATVLITATLGHGAGSPAGAEDLDGAVQSRPEQSSIDGRAGSGNRMMLPDVSLPVIKRKARTGTANKKVTEKAAKEAHKKAADTAKKNASRKSANKTLDEEKREQLLKQRAAARAAATKRAPARTETNETAKTEAAPKQRAEAKRRAEAKARRKAAREEAKHEARQATLEKQYDAWDEAVSTNEKAQRPPVPQRKPSYQSHRLPRYQRQPRPRYQRPGTATSSAYMSERELEQTLIAPPRARFDQRYSLDRVMRDHRLRSRLRRVDINTINFRYDDADVPPGQTYKLRKLGRVLRRIIARRPWEVFLIEGHTDLPGRNDYNLDLSEERAGSVKWILVDNFDLPPNSLVTRGYGEQFPVVDTERPERLNRRVSVRRITPLLRRAERRPRHFRPYRRYGRPYRRPYQRYRHPY